MVAINDAGDEVASTSRSESCLAAFASRAQRSHTSFASLVSTTSLSVGSHGEVHYRTILLSGSNHMSAITLGQEDMQGTAWTAYVGLVLTCLGSSILTVPRIMAQSGALLGCATLALPALLSMGSVRWLIRLAEASSTHSYQGIMSQHMGRAGDVFTFLTLNATIFLVASSCCTIIIEVVPTLISQLDSQRVALVICGACMLPAAARTLTLLHKLVGFGFLACIALVGLMVVRATMHGEVDRSVASARLTDVLPVSFALSNACFGVEMSILAVYREMRPKSRRYAIRSADMALLTCAVLYSVAGLAAYAQYGVRVRPNVLMSLEDDSWSVVAKVLLVLVNLARVPVFTILQRDLASTKFEFMRKLHEDHARHISRGVFGTVHVLASTLTGFLLASAGKALGIVGGTVGVAIHVGLPAMAWLAGRRSGTVPSCMVLDLLAVAAFLTIPLYVVIFIVSFIVNFDEL